MSLSEKIQAEIERCKQVIAYAKIDHEKGPDDIVKVSGHRIGLQMNKVVEFLNEILEDTNKKNTWDSYHYPLTGEYLADYVNKPTDIKLFYVKSSCKCFPPCYLPYDDTDHLLSRLPMEHHLKEVLQNHTPIKHSIHRALRNSENLNDRTKYFTFKEVICENIEKLKIFSCEL